MASIRRRKRAKQDVWHVDYRDSAGVRRRLTAATKAEAEEMKKKIEAAGAKVEIK